MELFRNMLSLFPAHAGVIPTTGKTLKETLAIPRTRGGDPTAQSSQDFLGDYSPHTRG